MCIVQLERGLPSIEGAATGLFIFVLPLSRDDGTIATSIAPSSPALLATRYGWLPLTRGSLSRGSSPRVPRHKGLALGHPVTIPFQSSIRHCLLDPLVLQR